MYIVCMYWLLTVLLTGNLAFRLGYYFYCATQREHAVVLLSVSVSLHQRFILTESGRTDLARARRKFQVKSMFSAQLIWSLQIYWLLMPSGVWMRHWGYSASFVSFADPLQIGVRYDEEVIPLYAESDPEPDPAPLLGCVLSPATSLHLEANVIPVELKRSHFIRSR